MAKGKKVYKRDKRSPMPKSDAVSKIMSHIKRQDTKPEILLRHALYKKGLRGYRKNFSALPGKPDIVFMTKRIAIFVHGCFWHGCEHCGRRIPRHNTAYWNTKIQKNIARDNIKRQILERMGFQVLEIWEHEIKQNLEEVVLRVQLFIACIRPIV